MTTPDELLPLVDQILNLVGEDRSALESWGQTADGQKVIQYVVQIGKYPTNIGQGEGVSIGDCFDRALLEEVRDLLRSQLAPTRLEIDWQKASRSLLNEQIQRLTTNPLTRPEDITLQTEQVYVPLGLVERKKVSRRGEDVSPEQGSLLYEETEITQKFEQGAFLEQVLRRVQSPRSGGRRIAVIGVPWSSSG
jgi:Effector-associated domain 10